MEAVTPCSNGSDETRNVASPGAEFLSAVGIVVLNQVTGHVRCPGQHLHTTPTAADHCTVFNNDGTLRLHCFHTSCRHVIEVWNRVLWRHTSGKAAGDQRSKPIRGPGHPSSPKPHAAHAMLTKVLQTFRWTYQDIATDSVGKVSDPAPRHFVLLLSLFHPEDILWVAHSVHHSGYPDFARNFRRAEDWRSEPECPGAYICPNAFKPGIFSRCNANVVHKRFLVVESDTLARDDMGAIFRYLMSLGYTLRAVVDTAGKSLHGWFVHPGDTEIRRLKRQLPALGCDPQMFSISQPVRLPGAVRGSASGTTHYQKLIYFNPHA